VRPRDGREERLTHVKCTTHRVEWSAHGKKKKKQQQQQKEGRPCCDVQVPEKRPFLCCYTIGRDGVSGGATASVGGGGDDGGGDDSDITC
jgi:hypothetical protein